MNRKYELLLNDTITAPDGSALYRIRALRDFGDVKAGDLGGYIAGGHNLSHEGTCWVADNAQVYGNAYVFSDARVYGNAQVYGYSEVCGNASVYGRAKVYGKAWVYDNARVGDYARVYGDARVCGNSLVYGNAEVNAQVYNNAVLCDDARFVNGDFGMKPEQTAQQNNYNISYSMHNFWVTARFVAKNHIAGLTEEQVQHSMLLSLKALKDLLNKEGYENVKFTSTLGYYIIPTDIVENKVFVEFAISTSLLNNENEVIL